MNDSTDPRLDPYDLPGGDPPEPGEGADAGADPVRDRAAPADASLEGEGPEDGGHSTEGTARVDELRSEIGLLNDRHLRLAAEFDNYRKRSQLQLAESGARAQAQLVGKLVEILDDFERITSIDPEIATVESVLEGVVLVERKLVQLLEEAGLEELDPEGSEFDPNEMEALARIPTEAPEEDDLVDQVLQRGFRFRGHLVRPARVSVRKLEGR